METHFFQKTKHKFVKMFLIFSRFAIRWLWRHNASMQGVKNGSVGPIRFRLSLFEVRQFTPRLHQLKVSTEKKEKSGCSFNNQSRGGHFTIGLLLNLINTSHHFSCCEQAMLLFYLNLKSSTNKLHMCMQCKLFNTIQLAIFQKVL